MRQLLGILLGGFALVESINCREMQSHGGQTTEYQTSEEITVLSDSTFLGAVSGGLVGYAGTVLIADGQNNRVIHLRGKTILGEYGSGGSGPGEYIFPGPIAIANGSVVVYDGGNRRINTYAFGGNFIRSVEILGMVTSAFTADDSGNVYVSAASPAGAIEKYNERGEVVNAFGTSLGTTGDDLQDRNRSRRHLHSLPNGDILAVGGARPVVEEYSPSGVLLRSADLSNDPTLVGRVQYADALYDQTKEANTVAVVVQSIDVADGTLSMLVITGTPGEDLASNTILLFDLRKWIVGGSVRIDPKVDAESHWFSTHSYIDARHIVLFHPRSAGLRIVELH